MQVAEQFQVAARVPERTDRPRLGFVGLGWIGLNRMQSLLTAELAEVLAVADADDTALSAAADLVPAARALHSFEELLKEELDGVVIATPSGMHAQQALAALERGFAVFSQKPLARTEPETRQIVAAARSANCLLGVDFSYRHVRGMNEARQLVVSGGLGKLFLIDLVFHNAYGPDKDWFFDASRSGGGCVIDLGTHLIDLAQWMLSDAEFDDVQSQLWRHGELFQPDGKYVEDAAAVSWRFTGGGHARLACSWHLHAGQDAVIEASFYGSRGSIILRNQNGSFYDFQVERNSGTQRKIMAEPSLEWQGAALASWTRRLAEGNSFDEQIAGVIDVARLIDGVYGR